MLEVRNLVKTYKTTKSKTKNRVTALNNVSITFPETGLVFLLGKSGSGKSTLLNAIGGLDSFDSGEIIIKGKSSKDFSQSDFDSYRNTFIGFIFQEYNVLEEFTVAKNLGMALELQGKKATKEEVNKLLEQVEMLEYAKRKPNQLSGGQKQRVAIARALIKNPEIIMADEPTGALDSNTGKQVMETLKKLSQEKLVIIVSHDREFAEIYGDRIIELKDGKIISDVSKKEIEPEKTESGISIIEDKIIHIKKGVSLTAEDIQKITYTISNQSKDTDVIISLDDKSNDQMKKINAITDEGNREVFAKTEPEDIKTKVHDPKNFKLIKSRLHFKDAFKMGASALKSKMAKLVFTIILSFISFAMFGLVDTLSAFNRPDAVYTTIEMTGDKHVSLLKESKVKSSSYNQSKPFTDSDIATLSEKFDSITFQPVVNRGIQFGSGGSSNGMRLSINDLDNSSNHPAFTPFFSGMVDINQEKLDKLGFTLTGDLPVENDPDDKIQICISKHLYECYKHNNEEITSEQDLIDNHNICNLENQYKGGSYDNKYKIVGIIDNHKDLSEYYNIEEEVFKGNYTMARSMLESKIRGTLDYGYTSMIFTTTSHYNSFLENKLNARGYFHFDDEYYNRDVELTYFDGEYQKNRTDFYNSVNYEEFNSNIKLKNNASLLTNTSEYQLADDEIILYQEFLYYINNDYDFQNDFDNSNITLKLRASSDPNTEVIKELKVVGYFTSEYEAGSNYVIVNSNLKKQLNSDTYYLFSEDRTDFLYTTIWQHNITTPKLALEERYGFDNKIIFYNGNDFETGDVNLTGNQIIIPWNYIAYNYENEQEGIQDAKDLIKNGLTITLKESYNPDSKTICTFQVVGLTNSYEKIYISEECYNANIKNNITGYDYVIATLSNNNNTNKAFIKTCEKFNDNNIKYTVQNSSTSILDSWGGTFEDITSVLIWVALGFAVFASLMLMSFISTSISYKKREIGILRALGARGSDVFGIFFIESLIIALINFVLAFTTTAIGAFCINNAIITELGIELALLTVSIRQFSLILGISILAAFIASIIPVSKISKKKPIDAINNR